MNTTLYKIYEEIEILEDWAKLAEEYPKLIVLEYDNAEPYQDLPYLDLSQEAKDRLDFLLNLDDQWDSGELTEQALELAYNLGSEPLVCISEPDDNIFKPGTAFHAIQELINK